MPDNDFLSQAWANLQGTFDHTVDDAKVALGMGPKVGVPPAQTLGSQQQVSGAAKGNDLWDAISSAPAAVTSWLASDPAKAALGRDAVTQLSNVANAVKGAFGHDLPGVDTAYSQPETVEALHSGLATLKQANDDWTDSLTASPLPTLGHRIRGVGEALAGVSDIVGAPASPAIRRASDFAGRTGTIPSGADFGASEVNVLRGGNPFPSAANVGPKEAASYWRSVIDTVGPLAFPGLEGEGAVKAEAGAAKEMGEAGEFKPAEPPPSPPPGPAARPAPAASSPSWQVGEEGWLSHPDGAPAYFGSPKDAAKFAVGTGQDLPGRWELRAFTHQDQTVWGLQRLATEGTSAAPEMAQAAAEAKVDGVNTMGEAVQTLPFHSDLPAATEDFLHNHTVAGQEVARLDPTTLYNLAQEGHLPFPELTGEVGNALANGGRVTVPMSAYLARVSGQPFADALHNTTRFGDTPSVAEAGSSSFIQDQSASPKINTGRLMSLLGANMYGDRSTQGATTLKELLQNSTDAVRQVNGGIGGNIHIDVHNADRTISIHDNGAGMTPDILSGPFLDVAGSLKEGDLPGGGFGMAKVLTLYGSDNLHVRSLRDGTYSELQAGGPDLNRAIQEGGSLPFTSKPAGEMTPKEQALFPDGHGTHVQVTIPKEFTDTNTGTLQSIHMPYSYYAPEEVNKSPLFAPLHVTYGPSRDVLPIGANFPSKDFLPLANVKFAWGEGRVYIKPNEAANKYGSVHILSNGLFQFSESLKHDDDQVPFEVYIDVRPTSKPGEPGYPFNFNRQSLTSSAREEMNKITKYIGRAFAFEALVGSAKGFGELRELTPGGAGQATSLAPKVDAPETGFLAPTAGQQMEVRDGELLINGKPAPEVDVNSLDIPKQQALKLPQATVDPSKLYIHDNAMLADGRSFSDWAIEHHPEAFHAINLAVAKMLEATRAGVLRGSDPQRLRTASEKYGGKDDVHLHEHALGISLDPRWGGVSVHIPLRMEMLNPYYGADSSDPLFNLTNRLTAAPLLRGFAIHEIAHDFARGHDAEHTNQMHYITAVLEGLKDPTLTSAMEKLDTTLQSHWDDWQAMREEFKNAKPREAGIEGVSAAAGDDEGGGSGSEEHALSSDGSRPPEGGGGGGIGGGGDGGDGGPPAEWPSDRKTDGWGDGARTSLAQQRAVLLGATFSLLRRSAIGADWAGVGAKGAWEALQDRIHSSADAEAFRRTNAQNTPEFQAFQEEETVRSRKRLETRSDVDLLSELSRKGGTRIRLDEGEEPLPGLPPEWFGGKSALYPEQVADDFGFASSQEMFSQLSDLRAQMVMGGHTTLASFLDARAAAMGKASAQAKFHAWPMDDAQAEKWAERFLPYEETRKFLEASLKDLATHDVGGEPLTIGEVWKRLAINQLRKEAEASWGKLSATEGSDTGAYRELMEKHGGAISREMGNREASGDPFEAQDANEAAFTSRRQQLRAQYQLQHAAFLDRAIRRALGILHDVARMEGCPLPNVDPEVSRLLRYVAVKMDVERPEGEFPSGADRRKAGVALERRVTAALGQLDIDGWRRKMNGKGYEPTVSTDLGSGVRRFREAKASEVEPGEGPPRKARPVRLSLEAREIALMVHSMDSIGRDLMTAGGRGVSGSLAEVGASAKLQADARGRYMGPAAGLSDLQTMGQWWGAHVIRPEQQFWWMDGEKPGLFYKSLSEPLDKGEKWRRQLGGHFAEMDRKVLKEIGGKVWIKSLQERVGDRVPSAHVQTDGGPVQVVGSKGDAIGAALHLGTEDGLLSLANGMGTDPAKLEEELRGVLGENDWKFVENMWAKMRDGRLQGRYGALERSMRGSRRPFKPGRSVLVGEGENWEHELEGAYWPAHYQWESGTPEGGPALGGPNLFGPNYRSALKEGPYEALSRIKSNYSHQVNIGFSALSHQLNAVLSDLAFRPGVVRGARMLQVPQVREALRDVLGSPYLDSIDKWMKYVSNLGVYDPSSINPLYNALMQARSNFMIAEVAANHTTFLRHSAVALSHLVGKGTKYLPRAMHDLTLGDRQANWKWVLQNSGEVKNALGALDWDVDEATERLAEAGVRSLSLKAASLMFTVPKMLESGITFLGVYRASVDKGMDHLDAVETADKAIRDTQGAVSNIHRPSIARMDRSPLGVIGSQGFIFQSFMNAQFNMEWLASRQARRGGRILKGLRGEQAAIARDEKRAGTDEEKAAISARKDAAEARSKEGKEDIKKALWNLIWFGVMPSMAIMGVEGLIDPKETMAQKAVRGMEGWLGGAVPYGESVFGAVRDFLALEEKARTGKGAKGRGDIALNLPQAEELNTFASLGADAFNALLYGKIVDSKLPTNVANALGFAYGLPTKEPGRIAQAAWDHSVLHKDAPKRAHRAARRARPSPGIINLWGGQPGAASPSPASAPSKFDE